MTTPTEYKSTYSFYRAMFGFLATNITKKGW